MSVAELCVWVLFRSHGRLGRAEGGILVWDMLCEKGRHRLTGHLCCGIHGDYSIDIFKRVAAGVL